MLDFKVVIFLMMPTLDDCWSGKEMIAWEAFKVVLYGFLDNRTDNNHTLGCKICIKIHFLLSGLATPHNNVVLLVILRKFSMEQKYQVRWVKSMLAEPEVSLRYFLNWKYKKLPKGNGLMKSFFDPALKLFFELELCFY